MINERAMTKSLVPSVFRFETVLLDCKLKKNTAVVKKIKPHI